MPSCTCLAKKVAHLLTTATKSGLEYRGSVFGVWPSERGSRCQCMKILWGLQIQIQQEDQKSLRLPEKLKIIPVGRL